jgi:NAD(P)-dependent dehydrogenase (short-subunit alcohol dehydrogenase family)
MTSALVTDAGRGIGPAITRHLSERGRDVYATARSTDDLRNLANVRNVHALALDITDRAAVAELDASHLAGNRKLLGRMHQLAGDPVVGDPGSRHRRLVRYRHHNLRSSP